MKELKESYKLQIKDGQSNFALGDKDIRQIFNRFRSTTLLNKYREFQFKLLHGAIYTKEKLEKFGLYRTIHALFVNRLKRHTHTYF